MAQKGDVDLGQTVRLTNPDDGFRLSGKPPQTNFRLDLRLTCEQPGVVLDTVGINAAPTGSYTLEVLADRTLSFRVWQPGWTDVRSSGPIGSGETQVVVERQLGDVTITVDGKPVGKGSIQAALSQQDLWIGDFPGDDSWGSKYRIHPAMVGTVRVASLAPLTTIEPVIDETGKLSASTRSRLKAALEQIGRQTGGTLQVVFCSASTTDEVLQVAKRYYEVLKTAKPNQPAGVLGFGAEGARGYSRNTAFEQKLSIDRVKATWEAAAGGTVEEKVVAQMEALAGIETAKPMVIGEAKIGPEGGKVSSSSGDFEVAIPPGALTETQTVRVTQLSAGSHGRCVEVQAGGRLLAKPATLSYRIPEGADVTTLVAVGQVTEDLWQVHPAQFNASTRMLTAKTNHFSNQGWFGMNKKQHQTIGATVAAGGSAVLIHFGSAAVFGTALVGSAPIVAVVAVFGVVGWFAGGAEYDMLAKRGFKGPLPVEGFDVYWKPGQVAGPGESALLLDKRSNKILAWVKDTDQWQPVGQGGTFEIQLPRGESIKMEDIATVKVPTSVLELATKLSETKRWYDQNGFNPPERTPVLVTNELPKLPSGEKDAGEFAESFLKVNGDLLSANSGDSLNVSATVAHEYFHAIVQKNGFKELFLGSEEAVATALESIVWPGANSGMTINKWLSAGPVLKNGLSGNGVGEGFSSPERRGYVLWGFPKFVFHRHGVADLKAVADGSMPGTLLKPMFREFTHALTNRDDGLSATEDSPLGEIATGWPVPLSELALSISKSGVGAGKIDLASPKANSVVVLTVRLPARSTGGPAPIIVRRRVPNPVEEFQVLKPVGSGGKSGAVLSDERGRDDVETGNGVVATPTVWDLGELTLPVVVGSTSSGGEEGNPILVYRLVPPSDLKSLPDTSGVRLQWTLPDLSGLNPADALWGYYVYGRTPNGEERLVAELRIDPDQSPNRLSAVGGSRSALTISDKAVEAILPAVLCTAFQNFGIASVDLVAANGSQPMVSEITWVAAPVDELLSELQKTQQVLMTIAGVTEVREGSPTEQSGYVSQLPVSTWGGFGKGVVDLARSYGKTLVTPQLTWSGPDFSLNMSTGPLEKPSTTREGTTVSKVSATLTVKGRYDAKRRSIVDMTFTYETKSTSVFTVDPNWKPRSAVDALRPPKASTTQARDYYSLAVDVVPFSGKMTDTAGNLIYTFKLDGTKLRPGCYADVERTTVTTDVVPSKYIRHITVGPPTLGVQVYQPGATVSFVLPKQ